MKSILKPLSVTALAVAALVATMPARAQGKITLQPRISAPIDDSSRVTLVGSRPSHSYLGRDIGAVDASMPIHSITLDFSRTPAQQAELDALVAAQSNVNSPLYHQWLTPEQFGARFGVSNDDILAVENWLQHEGFTIDRVARGNNHIVFEGTAGLVESAFGAPIHNFKSADGSIHFSPAKDLTIPAALASSVMSVRNLANYLPHAHFKRAPESRAKKNFTDVNNTTTGPYALSPGDIATQYDVNKAYQAGYTGAGQSIAVVGQSYILPSDVSTFQSLVGVATAKTPIFVLVPGTGTPELFEGDETESDIDVEYSSTIGKGAQVYFVYTGSDQTGVFESIEYAIDERIAPVITNSYGDCEVDNADGATSAATEIADFDTILEQGVAQGQTILSAAGDDGSVDCIEDTGDSFATLTSAAVDYPGSSPYASSIGGTEFPLADITTNASTYFQQNTTGSAPIVNSLIAYTTEQVWNDDDPYYGTSAGGGGASLYESQPTWQAAGTLIGGTGGTPIPTEPTITVSRKAVQPRLVPDISLFGSPDNPGLLVCSSDPSAWFTGQVGSCVNGFYDSTDSYLTIFGGTSFDAPIFAGMISIINQAVNATGQGNINTSLYSVASTANYATAFHDITSGSNACYDFYETESGYPAPPVPMPSICGVGAAVTEWSATTGYDMASGLGTVDLYNLIKAWPVTASASLLGTTTSFTGSTTPALSTADPLTITVASSTTPTGTLTLLLDGTAVNGSPFTLSGSGTVSYSLSTAVLGEHVLLATYSGDATHAASEGTFSVYAGTTTPYFTVSATNVTVTAGNSVGTTVTVTPLLGYTGLVGLTLTAPSSLTNACASISNATVSSATPVALTFTIYTNSNTCTNNGATPLARNSNGPLPHNRGTEMASAGKAPHQPAQTPAAPVAVTLAGILLLFCVKRRSMALRAGALLALLVVLSFAGISLTGCSTKTGTGTTTTPPPTTDYNSPTGMYTLTVTGTDSVNPALISTTTFTLTVQ